MNLPTFWVRWYRPQISSASPLIFLLNFLSYLCIIPFRIELATETFVVSNQKISLINYQITQSSFLSRCICSSFQIGGVFANLMDVHAYYTISYRDIGLSARILSLISEVSEVIKGLAFSRLISFQQNIIQDAVKSLNWKWQKPTTQNYIQSPKMSYILPVLTVMGSFILGLTSTSQRSTRDRMSAKIVILLEDSFHFLFGPSQHQIWTVYLKSIAHEIVSIWSFFSIRLNTTFEYNILFVLIYVLNQIGSKFINALEQTQSVQEVIISLQNFHTEY